MSSPLPQLLKSENERVVLPFVEWLQKLDFGTDGNSITLKRHKMILSSSKRIFAILNEKGKTKAVEPLTHWVKVQRVWVDSVGIEIVNALDRERILFQANAANFDFSIFDIKSQSFQSHVQNYMILPYTYDTIIGSGAGYRADPLNENSPLIDTYSYDEEFASPPTSAGSANTSSSSSSALSSLSLTKSNASSANSDSLDLKKEAVLLQSIESLRNTNARLTARFLIAQFTSDELIQKVRKLNSDAEFDAEVFDPNQYEPKKLVTKTPNGYIYGVNHKLNVESTFSLKEIIEIKEEENRLKIAGLSNELDILRRLKTSQNKSENLLFLREYHVDKTPFRTSHYLLMEPTVMNLYDACNMWIKAKDVKVTSIITAQILSGLSFLKDNFQTIHGNLTFKTVLFDFQGIIKLSGFEFSYSADSSIDADLLLSGDYEQDFLYKHPKIQEQASKAEKITTKANIDIWSLGCINYKLMTGTDLFIDAHSWKDFDAIVRKKQRLMDPIEIALSLLVSYQETAEPSTYLFQNNLQSLVNDNILNYCNPEAV